MVKIAVCDDEQIYIDKICKCIDNVLLEQKVSDYNITVYNSGKDVLADEKELLQYDVIFLDINMPGINGFELAKYIKENNINIYVVFVTSFLNYAIQGYRFDALRFILKSDIEMLMPECIETIIRLMKIDYHKIEYDFVEGRQEIIVNNICYIENYLHKLIFNFFCEKKTLGLYKKLDEVERDLTDYGFIRIRKNCLVNAKYIKRIINYAAVLWDGSEIPIPRDKIKIVKEKYYEMRGDRL